MSVEVEPITEGRRQWYNSSGEYRKPLIVGICGPSGSGKSKLCKDVIEALHMSWSAVISMDSFYKGLPNELKNRSTSEIIQLVNYDEPDAYNFEEAAKFVQAIKDGHRTSVPIYNFSTCDFEPVKRTVYGVDVLIFEGPYIFYTKELEDMFDLKLFVDADDDTRLSRRLRRDTGERGRTVPDCLIQYSKYVKPAYEKYILPEKKKANLIVPMYNNVDTTVVANLIVQEAKRVLSSSEWKPVYQQLTDFNSVPPGVFQLPDTPLIKAMQTVVRDSQTSVDDFIFHSDALCSLLVEAALTHLPYKKAVVTTPNGSEYEGEQFDSSICGVSIIRSGSSMEAPLRRICNGIKIGKILIQSDRSGCPTLLYVNLPNSIKDKKVLVLDPLLITGATATMAVHVLMDHDVKPSDIFFLTHVASYQGIHVKLSIYLLFFFMRVF